MGLVDGQGVRVTWLINHGRPQAILRWMRAKEGAANEYQFLVFKTFPQGDIFPSERLPVVNIICLNISKLPAE